MQLVCYGVNLPDLHIIFGGSKRKLMESSFVEPDESVGGTETLSNIFVIDEVVLILFTAAV